MAKKSIAPEDLWSCGACEEPNTYDDLVACDLCDTWYHKKCASLKNLPDDKESWVCMNCYKKKITKMEQEVDHIKKTEDLIKKLQGELAQMKLNSASNVKPEVIENKQQEDFQRNMFLWNQKQILMELPHFDGNPKDWSKFKNAFDVTTTQAEYSNLDNLSRLEKALKGTAAKSVQPLMISANNVPHIMRKLEEQFGQASMICRELRGDLERIKKLGNKTINEIADKLDCFIINMNTLNRADLLTDPRLLEELIWKLPYNLQVNWVEYTQKYVTQHQRQPALTELKDRKSVV